MTEITRVPLQPIARGSLTKLWLGVGAAVALAGGLAWAAMPKGVELDVVSQGTGASPGPNDVIFARYVGKLADGTVFDRSQDIPLPVDGVLPKGSPLPLNRMIPGFAEGAVKMRKGGKYTLFIPADQAYGATGQKGPQGEDIIPANSDLTFDVEMVDFMSEADFQRRIEYLQQVITRQQQGRGARPAAPANDMR